MSQESTASPAATPPDGLPYGPPYGIAARHVLEPPLRNRGTLLKVLILGVPIIAAMLGLLGGGAPRVMRVDAPAAAMSLEAPAVLRNGNWFENRVIVEAKADVADLVIAIDQPLWRRMSIDTLAPDAAMARATGDRFAYGFGPLRRGERFVLKLNGQIQPQWLRVLRGRVSILDGDRPIAAVSVSQLVLP